MDLAKEVAAATARLAKSSKDVAKSVGPNIDPRVLIDDVTKCILSTSDMIAVAKLVAPNIEEAENKRLMMEAVKTFDLKLNSCVENALKIGKDREALQKMESAGINVKKTLNALKSVLKDEEGNNVNEILHDIMKTSNALTTSQNYKETMSKVKDLTKITSKLIKTLEKEIAQEQDPEYKVNHS